MSTGKAPEELREGYTTGTCAAGAAAAGFHFLLTGEQPTTWSVPLPPPSGRQEISAPPLVIPVDRYEPEQGGVRVSVVKDGGDDPDATHGALIQAVVRIKARAGGDVRVELDGGKGVGRVTLPGLPVVVGEAAINPGPRAQIQAAVLEVAEKIGFSGLVKVVIEVPAGEVIAEKTMNARLGIVGGISILGTGGIVHPYSHDSWRASIKQSMDVARAAGLERMVLTTGRRTERFYLERFSDAPDRGIVQAADFFEFSMRSAADRGFKEVVWSLFFGKLVKQAMGFSYTHAKDSRIDFSLLGEWCRECLVEKADIAQVEKANTALEAACCLREGDRFGRVLALLISKASAHARSFASRSSETPPAVGCAVFDFDGKLLMFRDPC